MLGWGIAVLIVVAALAYVQRSVPPGLLRRMLSMRPVSQSVRPRCPTHTCRKHARWSVRMGLPGGRGWARGLTRRLRHRSARHHQLPVQQPSRLAKIKQQGRLTAAVQDDFPFSFLDAHQQRVGFDVDLMREFARRWLGDADAVTLVPVTTDRRIPTLLEGNVDLIAAALTNTPARQQQIAFSHTYLQDGQRLTGTRTR